MPPIHRALQHGTVTIDVRLLEEIEGLTQIDDAPEPSVVASLWARAEALRDAGQDPEFDDELYNDVHEAFDGCWLKIWEAHVVQRLRGWHRARGGQVACDAWWLSAAYNVLDDFTLGFNSGCDETLEELGLDQVRPAPGPSVLPVDRAAVLASMNDGRGCGECDWCTALRLRDEVNDVLNAAGFDGGSRFRAYCGPEPGIPEPAGR